MKIMICGSDGQLGWDCIRVFGADNEIFSFNRTQLDISDSHAVEDTVARVMPQVLINCAAFTHVDRCETEKETAFKINTLGPHHLAKACARHRATLVHVSTDYVFDGNRELPLAWSESDAPHPVSVYGQSKLEGEQKLATVWEDHIIVRTAWLYGAHGNNFLKTMLRLTLANPEKEFKVVDDQYGSPTWSLRLALQMERLVKEEGRGIYHATSEGYCSWYELAVFFLKKMDVPHNLIPCTTAQYPTPTARPFNSILENKRLKQENIHRMTGWRHGVEQFVSRFRNELLEAARLEIQ
ncbi:dTDP-4-dehydrorhamnose reductase [Desulfocicer vacuolatum DSM 3385]|uniref:dTDP-4-dehydrorhamnose reductase n=2 Tax=Desulfocicer vacuolatum TaxID=2298 RepID=A0A1W2AFF8_9BACT|nr:dTDP-4-dehydrorhamnose reductase [Desulfocicer vacuolatum DSM 3385]